MLIKGRFESDLAGFSTRFKALAAGAIYNLTQESAGRRLPFCAACIGGVQVNPRRWARILLNGAKGGIPHPYILPPRTGWEHWVR